MKYKSESKGAHLRASSVVVQTGEAGEVLFGDGGSRLGCNQTVGVGRISHNQHLKTHTHTHENKTDITQHKLIIVIDSLTITDSILEAAVVFFFLS